MHTYGLLIPFAQSPVADSRPQPTCCVGPELRLHSINACERHHVSKQTCIADIRAYRIQLYVVHIFVGSRIPMHGLLLNRSAPAEQHESDVAPGLAQLHRYRYIVSRMSQEYMKQSEAATWHALRDTARRRATAPDQ